MTLTIRFQVSLIDSPAAGGAGDGCREWAGGANAAQNRPTDALPVTVRQRATDSATIAVKVISATRSVAMSLISVAFASIRRSRVLPAARTPAFAISVAAALGVLGGAHPAEAATPTQRERLEAPVKAVADQRLTVDTPQGNAMLPVYADHPVDKVAPDITRVFIVIHGTLRNADAYYASGLKVVEKAGPVGQARWSSRRNS